MGSSYLKINLNVNEELPISSNCYFLTCVNKNDIKELEKPFFVN